MKEFEFSQEMSLPSEVNENLEGSNEVVNLPMAFINSGGIETDGSFAEKVSEVKEGTDGFLERGMEVFDAAFSVTRSAFAARRSETLKMYELETNQRKALAERHAEIRTACIQPLCSSVEDFKRFI